MVWLPLFALILVLWLWKRATGADTSSDLGMQPIMIPVYVFGVIASAFVIRGARWAQITIGIIALLVVVLVVWAIAESGWTWPRWHDGCAGIFSLVSAGILLVPRREKAMR